VAVIGRSHEKWGEVPVAIVALGAVSDQSLSLADLDEFLTERLARYKHPKHLEVVVALPRNPAGKVLKTELRDRFGATKLIDTDESSSATTVSAGKSQD
jgi:fatty-acyl-CoA synthase